ncbi:ribonuclease III domain-containing protein [Cladorrhinum sp. PSN259]|nr:ribonuclease III domain-containing protein [Cladorrhinum sp. PSN259]
MPGYGQLQDILGYQFSNPMLLDESTVVGGMTFKNTPGGREIPHGNKTLALIGDSLIRLDVATRAHISGVGKSSIYLAKIGSNKSLEELGRRLGLDKFVLTHPPQDGHVSRITLASTVEALIGAVWVDLSYDYATVQSVIQALNIVHPLRGE